MKSFIACAWITALTIFYTFMSFQVVAWIWLFSVDLELRTVALYSLLWLNQLTTAFIGIAAGLLAPRRERQRPILIAAIAAILVELLHSSASGAFRGDPPFTTAAVTAICGALAAGVAWLRLRLVPLPNQEEAR